MEASPKPFLELGAHSHPRHLPSLPNADPSSDGRLWHDRLSISSKSPSSSIHRYPAVHFHDPCAAQFLLCSSSPCSHLLLRNANRRVHRIRYSTQCGNPVYDTLLHCQLASSICD